MTVVRGQRVVLRAFLPEEMGLATTRMAGGSGTVGVGGQVERERRLLDRVERSGSRNDWEVLFAIEADGRLVGDAQGRCSETAMPPGVWEIGLEIWDADDRGRGLGREATGLLTGHLFAEQGAIRVQATTDLDNVAMRRTLDALGFGFEGVLRGFMPQAAVPPRDYAMYGITRDDWTTKKDGWTRTS